VVVAASQVVQSHVAASQQHKVKGKVGHDPPYFFAMIRCATQDDFAAIQACADAAYHVYIPAIGRKPAPMVADFEALISIQVVWVSDTDGFIVMYPRDDALHVENIAVHPDAQGRGIGRALMGFAQDHARTLGLTQISLYTNAKMTGPLALYPKLGYVEIDRRVEDGFDRVYFTKTLSEK
jgi:ribosomal protein S18 acetylase RimI-like enzyme